MSPLPRVPKRAFIAGLFALTVLAVPASAQLLYHDARQLLDLAPDPLARSPRHLGMGALRFVGPDPHMRITLWDFAQNMTGLGASDSTSTVELRPGTSAMSAESDILGSAPLAERQSIAAREVRFGFEGFVRPADGSGTTFGVFGSFNGLRFDRPFNQDVEQRSSFSSPDLTFAANGPMPYLYSDRMTYMLRVRWANQENKDTFRQIVRNQSGDYVDKDGGLLGPPDLFTPDETRVRTLGIGAAASMTWGDPLTVSLGYDYVSNSLLSKNDGNRHDAEVSEDRPFHTGQLSLIGKLGQNLEWGGDLRAWNAQGEQSWVFTISAGPGNPPLTGRGFLQDREEKGNSARGRLRWTSGDFEVGGGVSYLQSDIDWGAPLAGDPTSFNTFRNTIHNTVGADTLALPDSVVTNKVERRAIGAGGGIAWNFDKGTIGAEYQWVSDKNETMANGAGPEAMAWEVRSGIEYMVSTTTMLRGGYIYRFDDDDELTGQNEFLSNSVTLGLGFQPDGASWIVDAGYVHRWGQADFGDPTEPRADRHQLATQIRWTF